MAVPPAACWKPSFVAVQMGLIRIYQYYFNCKYIPEITWIYYQKYLVVIIVAWIMLRQELLL